MQVRHVLLTGVITGIHVTQITVVSLAATLDNRTTIVHRRISCVDPEIRILVRIALAEENRAVSVRRRNAHISLVEHSELSRQGIAGINLTETLDNPVLVCCAVMLFSVDAASRICLLETQAMLQHPVPKDFL